jgi:hypothetical protein
MTLHFAGSQMWGRLWGAGVSLRALVTQGRKSVESKLDAAG